MRPHVCCLLLVAACGDDEHLPPADAGPTPDVPAVAEPDAAPVQPFDDPSDFSHVDCEPGSLAAFDPSGVWHQDRAVAEYPLSPSVQRFEKDGAELRVWLDGMPAQDVLHTDDDLFVRVWATFGGFEYGLAYDACRVEADGRLWGRFAMCWKEDVAPEPECFEGEFTSYPIDRREGEDEAAGLTLVAEYAGEEGARWAEGFGMTLDVKVAGGFAYLVRGWDGLRVVDVADPSAPREVAHVTGGSVMEPEFWNDVELAVAGDARYALVASDTRGVVVFDVSDPGAPAEVAAFPPDGGEVHTLFLDGGRAYLADTAALGLDVWDVSNPASPAHLGSWVHPSAADPNNWNVLLHDLYVAGDRAYLDYWGEGLVIVDVSDPSAIAPVGEYDDYPRRTNHSSWVTTLGGGRRVAVTGDEDFGAHVHLVDVDESSPTFLERLGEFSLRPEVSVHNIVARGDHAYVAWYQDGIRVLDLSDPAAPREVAYFNSWRAADGGFAFYEGACGIDLDPGSRTVYVADTIRGLLILRETF